MKKIQIRKDAIELLMHHGISRDTAENMLGKTFGVLKNGPRSYQLDNGFYVDKAATCEPDIDPAILEDFMALI